MTDKKSGPKARFICSAVCRFRLIVANFAQKSFFHFVKLLFPATFFTLAACAFAVDTAFITPVGYTTADGIQTGFTVPVGMVSEQLRPGMNLVGLRLHEPTLHDGSIGAIGAIGADFVELTKVNSNEQSIAKLTRGTRELFLAAADLLI